MRFQILPKAGFEPIIVYTHGNPPLEKQIEFIHVKLRKLPKPLNYLTSKRKVWDQIRDIDFDLIYSLSGLQFEYYCSYWKEKSGKPWVMFLRGDLRKVERSMRKLTPWLYHALHYQSLRNVDKVIPIASHLRKVAKLYGIPQYKITKPIPNGIDTELFKPLSNPDGYVIGYAGRISKEKGFKFLLKVMKATPEIQYYVAGRTQMRWKPPENCEYWGEIPHEEMPKFYSKCALIALPSHTEGFPNTILEAYACQRPILVSPQAIPRECKLFGLEIKHDYRLWIYAIKYLKYYFEILDLGETARKYVIENFTWEKHLKAITKIFHEVVEGNPPRNTQNRPGIHRNPAPNHLMDTKPTRNGKNKHTHIRIQPHNRIHRSPHAHNLPHPRNKTPMEVDT